MVNIHFKVILDCSLQNWIHKKKCLSFRKTIRKRWTQHSEHCRRSHTRHMKSYFVNYAKDSRCQTLGSLMRVNWPRSGDCYRLSFDWMNLCDTCRQFCQWITMRFEKKTCSALNVWTIDDLLLQCHKTGFFSSCIQHIHMDCF